MKFGKQLQLGTYEPWKDYYIQYNKLKRIIKRRKFITDQKIDKMKKTASESKLKKNDSSIELKKMSSLTTINEESLPLISTDTYASPSDKTLNRYNSLESGYELQHRSLIDEEDNVEFFPVILEEMNKINKFFVGKMAELRILLDEITSIRSNMYLSHHTNSDPTFLTRLRSIYVDLAALRSYCNLSKTGFYKIIKKYDKTMGESTLEAWMKTVDRQPFSITEEPLQLMDVVTSLVSRDKLIEWERFATEQQNKSTDDLFPAVRLYGLIISILIFIISLYFPLITPSDPCASRCMSLFLLTLSLWITEAIPYYATAMLVSPLVVILGVLKDPEDSTKSMSPDLAANYVMNHLFNHTTMLLIGGYTISTAFSRCQLELRIAAFLQKKLGNNPSLFILAIMFLGLFLSMWISNHTAPILCATIILPIVRDLSTDSRFAKALLLGLAYACNFGGMMTPISSLQNVLAVSYLEQSGVQVSFGRWMCVSLPFSIINVIVAWLFILLVIQPDDITSIPIIVYERGSFLGKKNIAVIVLSLLTIIMFASFKDIEHIFGDIGIVAMCFVTIMFGSGILSEVDFNSLSWHTVFLVGGGNVLGKAIASSGLLGYISDEIVKGLPLDKPWIALIMILIFVLTSATFVSHTVASLILMPVISTLGVTLGMPEMAVMGSAFAVSAAMALPFSSFPNVNSVLIVDDFQRPYLVVNDFIKTGLPLSLFTVMLIVTLGFLLIKLIIVDH